MRDPRRAYRVVDMFEEELADYTGAPYAVAVNSCTNALLLALVWERMRGINGPVLLPRRTYVGVLQSVLNAGYDVVWAKKDWTWHSIYDLNPTRVVDAARMLSPQTFEWGLLTCLSFHSAKQLPLGRGGAILTDDEQAARWFRAARMDGRPPGAPIEDTAFPGFHCPLAPDVAARGLDILSRWNDAGYSPPPLPSTEYPDLSQLNYGEGPGDAQTPRAMTQEA
jgi:dTDP-4-amino-4,6-dideoxygalactose transaminase